MEKARYGPASVGLEEFFPQGPSASRDQIGPQQLTRRLRIRAKRLGSGESHVTLDSTLQPLYFLSKPFGPMKPLFELHLGRDDSGPVIAFGRRQPVGIGLDLQYGNDYDAPNWVAMKGSPLSWARGEQRFNLQGRTFVWSHQRTVQGMRAESRAGYLVMQDAATSEVCAMWERKSWNRHGDHGILMLRENLGEEAEAMTVLTALVWDDGKAALKVASGRYIAGGAGLGMLGGGFL